DPEAVAMAAFTRENPSDRAAFDAHHERIRTNPETRLYAIDADGEFVGTVGSYPMHGQREVTYWISREHWGRGFATAALRALLAIEPTRPLFASAAEHNVASATVLRRAGFVEFGSDTGYARGVDAEIVERLFRLD